jgi:hypothetical protein
LSESHMQPRVCVMSTHAHATTHALHNPTGQDSYVSQCYFLTHLIFVLSGWGAVRLTPASLFVEEILFLISNMDVAIHMRDPELVGEFVQR